jgi:RimJ/RimL family protein N-acetyltransferase
VEVAFSPITTDRLLLRPPLASDAEAIFTQYAADELVTQYVGWLRHKTLSETYAFLQFSDHEWEKWSAGPLLIAHEIESPRSLAFPNLGTSALQNVCVYSTILGIT